MAPGFPASKPSAEGEQLGLVAILRACDSRYALNYPKRYRISRVSGVVSAELDRRIFVLGVRSKVI